MEKKCRKHRWSEEILIHKEVLDTSPGSINILFPMHYRVNICKVCYKIKGVR